MHNVRQTKLVRHTGQTYFKNLVLNTASSAASRCILVPFERYGRPKNEPKKVLVTLFPYIFHVKTK